MPNARLLEPMPDPELLGHALDLKRPELRPLMERYGSDRNRSLPGLLDPPTALVVTRSADQDEPLHEAFHDEGWSVVTCRGPGVGECPVLRGRQCPLRASADAAVVYVSGDATSMPRLRCAADSASPGVVVVEGSLDGPRYGTTTATVGALRGRAAVTTAVKHLLGSAGAMP